MDPLSSSLPPSDAQSGAAAVVVDADRVTLGQMLRLAREQRALTLQQISEMTNIQLAHLEAYERDDFAGAVPGMYQRAEIRAIADAVGLDTRKALIAAERPAPRRNEVAEASPALVSIPPQAPPTVAPAAVPVTPAETTTAPLPTTIVPTGPTTAPVVTPTAPVATRTARAATTTAPAAKPVARVVTTPAPVAKSAGRARRSISAAVPAAVVTAAVIAVAWLAFRTSPPSDTPRESTTAATVRPSRSGTERPSPTTAGYELSKAPAPSPTPSSESSPVVQSPARAAVVERTVNQVGDEAAAPVSTSLRIITEPAGATVTVDGVGWGQTPVTIRYLPPGAKRIRVTRDGYVAAEQVVPVAGDRPQTVVRLALRRR